MDINELKRLTLPKLKDLAKQETELKGVGGMDKEELIKAIAEAKGIPYEESHKDVNAIHGVKQDIRVLKQQKAELLSANGDRKKIKKVQRQIKLLKRLTRHLAHEVKTGKAAKAAQAGSATSAAG